MTYVLNGVDATLLLFELDELLKRLLHGNQLALRLGALVVAVADVDSAGLGFFGADDCDDRVSVAS